MGTYDIRSGPDLGAALAEVRLANDLTQAELATMVGWTATYVSKVENGRTTPLIDHKIRMLRRMGATITIDFDDAPAH